MTKNPISTAIAAPRFATGSVVNTGSMLMHLALPYSRIGHPSVHADIFPSDARMHHSTRYPAHP